MRKPRRASDWSKQLEFDMRFAEKTLRENGSVETMFSVYSKEKVSVFPAPWRSPLEKDLYHSIAWAMCVAHDADAVSLMTEAWVRSEKRRPDESKAAMLARARSGPSPAQSEDRREVVMLWLAYRDEIGEIQHRALAREIERRASGTVVGLKPVDFGEAIPEPGFRLSSILPEERPTPEWRAKAEALLERLGQDIPIRTN